MTAQQVGSYKPDERNFAALTARLGAAGVPKERILHVAQSLFHDHAPAQRLGFRRSGSTAATTGPAVARPRPRTPGPMRPSSRWPPSRPQPSRTRMTPRDENQPSVEDVAGEAIGWMATSPAVGRIDLGDAGPIDRPLPYLWFAVASRVRFAADGTDAAIARVRSWYGARGRPEFAWSLGPRHHPGRPGGPAAGAPATRTA